MRTWLTLLCLLWTGVAEAHPLAPSLLRLRELADGNLELLWKQSRLQPRGVELEPVLPEACTELTPRRARWSEDRLVWWQHLGCDPRGKPFSVRGLAASGANVIVSVELGDGAAIRTVLDAERTRFVVPERERSLQVFNDYARLGMEHLWRGADHLLFLLALVLWLPTWRGLVLAVSAFTLGHSVSLFLVSMGWVTFPPAPIELAIAASLLLLANQLAGARDRTLTRFPGSLTFAFGLLHGCGFAGALNQLGLASASLPLAVLSFNLGIEFAQLVVVAAWLTLAAMLRPLHGRFPHWPRRLPAYAIGSLAALWCIERSLEWLS